MKILLSMLLIVISSVLLTNCNEREGCTGEKFFVKFLGKLITEDGNPIVNANFCVSLSGIADVEDCSSNDQGKEQFDMSDIGCSHTDENGDFSLESELGDGNWGKGNQEADIIGLETINIMIAGAITTRSWSGQMERMCKIPFVSGWKPLYLKDSDQIFVFGSKAEVNMDFVALGVYKNSIDEALSSCSSNTYPVGTTEPAE